VWARQTGSEGCSPEYRVQPGDPCVPLVTGDQTCADDVDAVNVQVVGTDVYDLDGDGDGIACDADVPVGATTTATPPAPDPVDVGTVALHVGLGVLVAWLVAVAWAGGLVWLRNHRAADDDQERRSNVAAAAMALVTTALSLLVALVSVLLV
jgi:hypothetical protein